MGGYNYIYVLKYYFECKKQSVEDIEGDYNYEVRDDGGLIEVEVRGMRSNQISNIFWRQNLQDLFIL